MKKHKNNPPQKTKHKKSYQQWFADTSFVSPGQQELLDILAFLFVCLIYLHYLFL